MWSGPIHDTEFVTRVLEHLERDEKKYGTAVRMKGMLTVAKEVSNDLSAKRKLNDCFHRIGTSYSFLFHSKPSWRILSLYFTSIGRCSVRIPITSIFVSFLDKQYFVDPRCSMLDNKSLDHMQWQVH
jgi:hypothetical protein